MMMNTTLNQLRSLRLETMAQALELQLQTSGITTMSFEERLALLVDREVHGRQDRRCARLLKLAKLKYPQAAIEDLDSRTRGIERSAVMSLALCEWGYPGPRRADYRRHRSGQILAGLCLGTTRLQARPKRLLPARTAPGRGAAYTPRQRHIHALAGH
jgi:hypothetical protein